MSLLDCRVDLLPALKQQILTASTPEAAQTAQRAFDTICAEHRAFFRICYELAVGWHYRSAASLFPATVGAVSSP